MVDTSIDALLCTFSISWLSVLLSGNQITVQYSIIGLTRDLHNNLKFAFEIILLIWIRNSNERSKCTPTSFFQVLIGQVNVAYVTGVIRIIFAIVNTFTLIYFEWKLPFGWPFSHLLMSSCIIVMSWKDFMALKMLASSAKSFMKDSTIFGISLIKMVNRMGPRTLPGGMPDVTGCNLIFGCQERPAGYGRWESSQSI